MSKFLKSHGRTALLLAACCSLGPAGATGFSQMGAMAQPANTVSTPGLLPREAVAPLVPPAVFFAGKVATTQARNAAAVRLSDGKLVLAVLVDTSGYSTSIQDKYQAYLITEAPLSIDGHTLKPGAYGCGFIANNQFIVMDVGGGELFTAHSVRDDEMRRPTPLQMQASGADYRLYAGRSYVTIRPAAAAR